MNRRALLLLPVLAVSSGAFAQSGPLTSEAYWGGLKKRLRIKPGQEAAWKKYSSAVDHVATQSSGKGAKMYAGMGTATWHQRCVMMNNAITGPQAADAARKAAAELLPVLDTTQKAAAPSMLPAFALPPGPGFG